MRKLYLFFFISVLSCGASAQTAIYARFINYNNQVLKNDGTLASSTGLLTTNTINPNSNELFPLTTFTENTVQTLNIGSQSTGAGAGKIVFNPMTFTRPVDATSPLMFSVSASGTAFRTMEVFYVDGQNNINYKQVYKLVAVKTIAWSGASCSGDCPAAIENISMEYGGQINQIYRVNGKTLASPITKGWNRVKNIQDDDPNTVIQ